MSPISSVRVSGSLSGTQSNSRGNCRPSVTTAPTCHRFRTSDTHMFAISDGSMHVSAPAPALLPKTELQHLLPLLKNGVKFRQPLPLTKAIDFAKFQTKRFFQRISLKERLPTDADTFSTIFNDTLERLILEIASNKHRKAPRMATT